MSEWDFHAHLVWKLPCLIQFKTILRSFPSKSDSRLGRKCGWNPGHLVTSPCPVLHRINQASERNITELCAMISFAEANRQNSKFPHNTHRLLVERGSTYVMCTYERMCTQTTICTCTSHDAWLSHDFELKLSSHIFRIL